MVCIEGREGFHHATQGGNAGDGEGEGEGKKCEAARTGVRTQLVAE